MRRSPSLGRLKFVPPQLPRLVETPPESDDWIHEIKYDGYRTQVIIDWDGARAYTKTWIDWTSRYWPIVTAAEALGARSAIIDGEVIAPTPNGAPDFRALRSAMAWNADSWLSISCTSTAKTLGRCRSLSGGRCFGIWSSRQTA
jgi:ATP-dependent DNA ligase